MQIFSGNNLALSVDVYAPKPTADAWNIEGAVNDKGAFTLGSKVKITLALDENITLANVGSNKIVVAGKDFLLTGTNGTVTKTLEFVYTVQLNDKIDTAKIMSLSNVNVNLISSPIVNTPLLLATPLSIRQALFFRGSGANR
jgi:hypothetical protein